MEEKHGRRRKNEERTQKAVEGLIARIDENPYDPQAYYALGCLLTELQSFEQAEELFKRALNVFEGQEDKQALLHYGLGNVLYSAGLFKEAAAEFEVLKGSPYEADAVLMMAQTELSGGSSEKALAYALTAFEKGSGQTRLDACALLGDAFLSLGSFRQAGDYYDLYLKEKPDDKRVLFMRGVAETGAGNAPDAWFERVKKIDGKYFARMTERLDDISRVLNDGKKE